MTLVKPDVIVTWPRNNDYPIWREMIRGYRHKLGDVFIIFMNTNDNADYSKFVRRSMDADGVIFIDSPDIPKDGDWRDISVKAGLKNSFSEWVWFTEQDFFAKDSFWDYAKRGMEHGSDVIATYQGDRMHPCSMFVRRSVLDKTCLNFGIVPDKSDHFGLIQNDLEELTEKIDRIPKHFYSHLNGLSQNFTILRNGGMPNYEPRVFNNYLRTCLRCNVPLDKGWVKLVKAYLERIN